MAARLVVAGTGMAFYLAALVLPTYSPFNPHFSDTVYSGAHAFRAGWRAIMAFEPKEVDFWLLSAAWLANPVLWISFVAAGCGRWRIASVFSSCGLVLSLTVLLRFSSMVVGYPGFWAWSGSASILLIGSSILWRRPLRTHRVVQIQ